jgi:hypothetical protein
MSSLITKTIEPATGTTLTLGAGGDTVLVSADQLKTNTVKDAGGNTLFTSDGAGTLSSVNSGLSGNMIFISSQTASSSASLSFTTGIDSTYDEYVFYFVNMNPATNAVYFQFQGSTNSGSSYGVNITSSNFSAEKNEDDTGGDLGYWATGDLSDSTSYQLLTDTQGNGSDESLSGELHLFAPSSTTYVKQFYSITQQYQESNRSLEDFASGYFDTTSAIDAVDFKFSSGNINAGTIAMYGIL